MAVEVSVKLAPLQHQSAPLRNKIISSLRNAIETGLLKPGARLIERDLCEQLNVSRTSLREALRELAADGVLSHTGNRGLYVRVLTPEEARNAYSIRAVLEALVVEQFIQRADDDEVNKLFIDGAALKDAYLSGVVDRILATKRVFFDRICLGAQNNMAFDIINRLVLRTSNLRSRSVARQERQLESVTEIENLLTAIRARNIPAARKAAMVHVEKAALSALGPVDSPDEMEPEPAKVVMPARKGRPAVRKQ
jgi:DNA-binding GntR family transcriptional regulator